jgi:hypothetical protein
MVALLLERLTTGLKACPSLSQGGGFSDSVSLTKERARVWVCANAALQ